MRLSILPLTLFAALALAPSLVQAQAPSPAASPPAGPRPYVSAFCAPIAMSEADPAHLRQHLTYWDARLEADNQASAFRPQDADAPGQMVVFPDDKAAPHAFIERRRGTCSLVYPGAKAPAALLDDLRTNKIPVGPKLPPVAWRTVSSKRVGPPGPIRYFLPASDDGRFGLCATIFEDLRLHDGQAATLVRVETCRLRDDETIDNG
jgi:hypothetical protein